MAGLYSRELLVEIAILIAVGAMRWAIESRGKRPEYRSKCPHGCRRRKEFMFHPETAELTIKGAVYERQALLREVNDHKNGLLIYRETYEVWSRFRLGGQWEMLGGEQEGQKTVFMIMPRPTKGCNEEETIGDSDEGALLCN
jgi:hypothetical protein